MAGNILLRVQPAEKQKVLRQDNMKYQNVRGGVFVSRPNRFVAEVELFIAPALL